MNERAAVLVVSCYELGHQPLAAGMVLAFLERAGHSSRAVDLAVEPLERLDAVLAELRPSLVAISVPMHTALHVGLRAIARVRAAAPRAHVCCYGLYASLNARHLLAGACDSILGGEVEERIVALADALGAGRHPASVDGLALPGRPAPPQLARPSFMPPRRDALPELGRYARLIVDGETRLAGAVEASRGCLHVCRHCPITPVYGGRFFVVPQAVVLQDIRSLVAAGARHITFADPDFLNAPTHALALARALHDGHPGVTFDVTTRVEHILERPDAFARLAAWGCAFVVSAVESLSDVVLGHLLKGHTRRDVFAALAILRRAGIPLRPSFVAFTPWTTLDDFRELLDWVEREDLVQHVDAIQYAIRLLVPPGSPLAELPALLPHLRGLRAETLTWAWEHPDPRMDRLQRDLLAIVQDATQSGQDAATVFERVRDRVDELAGEAAPVRPASRHRPGLERAAPPRLTEPWFC